MNLEILVHAEAPPSEAGGTTLFSEQPSVPQILTAISNADLEQSIKQFVLDLLGLHVEDKFLTTFELHEEFIFK